MSEINPIKFKENLRDTLSRYIGTTLPISRRYPNLKAKFREILSAQSLVTGPFVEALSDFEKGKTLRELLKKNGGFLHDGMENLPHIDRPLHFHQENALTKAVRDQKSLLVATGTGSGKTETFLYPILHKLLSDPNPEEPGVRVLLIYPMNALANDQLFFRIAPMLARYLAQYNITFGRYTGQIRANISREEENQRLINNSKLSIVLNNLTTIPANWLLTREEMLKNPPKLLITNYAMLEHLLLLPRNAPLFNAQKLHTIVLDEIHTYSGAQATEVAFLLRKLKNRLNIQNALQVFGTSASLAPGEEADQGLIEFSAQLFGEKVHEVVRGKRIQHDRLQQQDDLFSLDANQWIELGKVIEKILTYADEQRTALALSEQIKALGLPVPKVDATSNETFGQYLERVMSTNSEIRKVADVLDEQGVCHFEKLVEHVFTNAQNSENHDALGAVIRVGMLAKADEMSFPLLPARYHLAVNGIEGIVVRLSSTLEGWEEIRVGRQHHGENGLYYPMLVCRKCGQPFIETYQINSMLQGCRPEIDGGHAERKIFWLGSPPNQNVDDEDDEEGAPTQVDRIRIDPISGTLLNNMANNPNAITLANVKTETDNEEGATYVTKCPACGSRSSGADAEILTRMHPGNEALASVVTQRVLESLPPVPVDHTQPRPAMGRSLLTFSDNRQNAAFFAPYFERTSAQIALRSAIYRVLQDGNNNCLDARQLAEKIYSLWNMADAQAVLFDADGGLITDEHDVITQLIGAIGAEFCTSSGRRNSLEALGLVRVTYENNRLKSLRNMVVNSLPEVLIGQVDALLHILLETIRREKALADFYGIDLRSETIWGTAYKGHRSFEQQAANPRVSNRWLPPENGNRNNRRTWYLVEQLGMDRLSAMQLLRDIWEGLTNPQSQFLQLHNPGFALKGELIRFASTSHHAKYVCQSCGLIQQHVVNNKCTAFGCRGVVDELSDEEWEEYSEHNHYVFSYGETEHRTVRAREHTASLSTTLRETIEQDFADKKINVLSCTTTMEMGVDLGDLEAVVNLNVPPGIANYQQRTGRAGRRAQAAPFCVTVARNSQYDQVVYHDFSAYLKSSPPIPFVHLENEELFWRHQQSVLLSHFLKSRITDLTINAPTMQHLFGANFDSGMLQQFRETVQAWLESGSGQNAVSEAERLRTRLPEEIRHLGSSGKYLKERFVDILSEFSDEVSGRWSSYKERKRESAQQNNYQQAAYWANMATRFMGQYLTDQLSNRGLIPTYSFPVHSLKLEVIREQNAGYNYGTSEIELSRDASLGVSEYAPGSEVIANGRIWTSAGIASYPKQFMPTRWYIACPECFHVDIADTKECLPLSCGNCGSTTRRNKRIFIEPKGFVTAYENRKGRDPGSSRRRVKPADEARLIASPKDDQLNDTGITSIKTVLLKASSNSIGNVSGRMFIANRGAYGEGYLKCSRCNYTISKREGRESRYPHKHLLTGETCINAQLQNVGFDLVHQFDTDVRIYRFSIPLPISSETEQSPRNFAGRVARTLSEACRLASASLLGLTSSAFRATYRLFGATPGLLEIVLYDAVPGGAGYCAKLGSSNFTHIKLLQQLKHQLDCPDQCTNGCRQCLCDYANQRYWDSFERVIALEWVDKLLKQHLDNANDFERWANPSLAALTDRLANYQSVYLVARQLVSDENWDQGSLNFMINWMNQGKEIIVLLTESVEKRPHSGIALDVYRHLHPYVMNGQLKLKQIAKTDNERWATLPRVFPQLQRDVSLFYQSFSHQSIMSGILGAEIQIRSCTDTLYQELSNIIQNGIPLSTDIFSEGQNFSLYEFVVGADRSIHTIFNEINRSYVEKMRIIDPFIGTQQHRDKLKTFIQQIKGLAQTVSKIEISCREMKPVNNGYEHRFHVKAAIDGILRELGFDENQIEVYVQDHRTPAREFHDREVNFEVIAPDGTTTVHRYFLTGGIDYLIDKRGATRVIHHQYQN